MPPRDTRLAWAEATLRTCRNMALSYVGRPLRIERKADQSPVTIADRTIEAYLRRQLAHAFPGEAIVGEEFGRPAALGSSYWTIDPIDGTRAFSRGLPSWGILLSYVEHGRPILGACDYPVFNTFLGVGPGQAAYERRGSQRIVLRRATPVKKLESAVIFHGGSKFWSGTRYARGFARIAHDCYLERAYGDCFAYLWLFRGRADAIIDYGVKLWDLAPFAALAGATGRVITDCAGRPGFTGPESILAHPTLNRTLTRLLASHA